MCVRSLLVEIKCALTAHFRARNSMFNIKLHLRELLIPRGAALFES